MSFRKNNKGITLVETVIALTLVTILATVFAGAMTIGLKSEETSNNLDNAVNFSASIFDYFNQEFENVLNNIELTSNSYNKTLENFKNDYSNSNFNNQFYDFHIEKFSYDSSNSKIIINRFDEDLKLYNVKLIISWNDGSENGSYEIESIFGDSYE